MANLLEKFERTTLSDDKTKFLLGKCLRNSFDKEISNSLNAEEILALAWKFQVPQFDEMFQDYQDQDCIY